LLSNVVVLTIIISLINIANATQEITSGQKKIIVNKMLDDGFLDQKCIDYLGGKENTISVSPLYLNSNSDNFQYLVTSGKNTNPCICGARKCFYYIYDNDKKNYRLLLEAGHISKFKKTDILSNGYFDFLIGDYFQGGQILYLLYFKFDGKKYVKEYEKKITDKEWEAIFILNSQDSIKKILNIEDKKKSLKVSNKSKLIEENDFTLHKAIRDSNRNDIISLIDNGSNVDEINDEGLSPLHTATLMENKGIVALLIVAGANVDIKSPVTENTPLHIASSLGNDALVEIFLNEGANFNSSNKEGDTALHISAKNGFNSIVEKLIQKNINVNTTNDKGQTALHIASIEGHSSIVQMLIKADANLNIKDSKGKTARNYAISSGHQNVIIYLDNQKNEEIIKHQSNPTNAIVDENIQALTDQRENLFEQANSLRQDLFRLNQKIEQISMPYRQRIERLRPYNRQMSSEEYNRIEREVYRIEQQLAQAISPYMQEAQFKMERLKRIEQQIKEIENKLKLFKR
jgi:ankyrin repeat protein